MGTCATCGVKFEDRWRMTGHESNYRNLGVPNAYFMSFEKGKGNTPQIAYCYCKTCWENTLLDVPTVKQKTDELEINNQSLVKEITSLKDRLIKFENEKKQIDAEVKQNNSKINELQQSLEEKATSSYYQLNPVESHHNSKYTPTDNDKHELNIGLYNTTSNKHTDILQTWNVETSKLKNIVSFVENNSIVNMALDDDKKNEDEPCFGEKLYAKYIECCSNLNQQSKRLKQTTSSSHLMELIQQQNLILEQLSKGESAACTDAERYDKLNKQYQITNQQRINAENTIKSAMDRCNELIQKENELFNQVTQTQVIKEHSEKQMKDLKSSSTKCISLIDSYNEFMQNNKKCINELNEYFNKTWNEFESKWWEWKIGDILSWFKYKTMAKFKNITMVNWDNIQGELKKREINGESLAKFNDSTLDLIGLHNFNVSTYLMTQITNLRNKYKIGGDASVNDDEKSDNKSTIPSKFICPLTKKIMKDPVIAFDGKTYERDAIEKYLKVHKKSPVTNGKAYTLNTFPNMQLQEEIQSYIELNNVNNLGDIEQQQEGADTNFID